ncbi:MAG TPA: hypothetical protein VF605_05860 [Allosphingosinicella sp.]|jgi:hypothetical protein
MVAIITGNAFGLGRSSLSVLGAGGQIGNAQQGRGPGTVFVNAATGNLTLTHDDEFLVGRGPTRPIRSITTARAAAARAAGASPETR